MLFQKFTFSCVKSISEHIELLSKIKKHTKKIHKKLTVWGGMGGVNAYGQPDRKVSTFFYDSPKSLV